MWAITIYYELVDAGWDRMTALRLARYAVEVHNQDSQDTGQQDMKEAA
jgi:hypothetical protein